ncbi:2-oxoacid:ferredoxin oxidoreductase subunit beta [Limnochorda pilosa]|uniref:2-oxoacid ferredoxin oxidoreductase n=1 Tax=Limnochorda pilosa TaxID=1555112 RepID=A0A0K2SQG9_LIMPI|nr:2-oxoacid:ferredoxin oxidoreductase subunit beta [Limnochorda pilosa]BAS29346.1 2-oxoacid ferredoxin oxidoreductase [Limnochorda pilosa]
MAVSQVLPKQYRSQNKPTWCPGCGDYAVLEATTRALAALQVEPHEVAVISGIGCSSRFPIFLNAYGFHGVHGRVLPIATGLKLANPKLTVLAVGGDGDGLAIGAGHFPHAVRRNPDITYVMMDNSIYGLTKGQVSPTSPVSLVSSTTPVGNVDRPLNPVAMAIAYGASFVARGASSSLDQLADLIRRGIEHRGFAFIHAVSPCPTFNNTYKQVKTNTASLPDGYDPRNQVRAFELAITSERIFTGVFYQQPEAIAYDERLEAQRPRETVDPRAYIRELIDAYR